MSVGTIDKVDGRNPIDLSGAHLHGADLSGTNLCRANFSMANLAEMDFERANLQHANFHESNLAGANLSFADLSFADLTGCDLSGAQLSNANLTGITFNWTTFRGARLKQTDLREVENLSWQILLTAKIDETTCLPEYLSEDDLVNYLESSNPNINWRDEISDSLSSLIKSLAEIADQQDDTISNVLVKFRVYQEGAFDQEFSLNDQEDSFDD